MILDLGNGKKIDIYNPTANEIEELAQFLILSYMRKNDKTIEDLDMVQDKNSIFYLVATDIYLHNQWAGNILILILKNKYKIDVMI